MLDQPPFPVARHSEDGEGELEEVGVIIPTRNRPERLGRCLDALAAAQKFGAIPVHVCDSSAPDLVAQVREICDRHPFVKLVRHDRRGASAARNVGTQASRSRLIVSIDDDVYVEPDAIARLVDAARRQDGPSVIAGTVAWSHWSSRPLVMRRIGFAREARAGESVEFLVSALILYPRELALALPWNERLWPYDDRYVSLIWRAAGATLGFAPDARARHDSEHTEYPVAREADRIYVNLFDALLISRSMRRALVFEFLSFAACVKKWGRTPRGAGRILLAWGRGHAALVRDFGLLRRAARCAERRRLGTDS